MEKTLKAKIDNKMDILCSWQRIRIIAELKFVRTSYSWVLVVPIFVKLFSLANEKIAQLTIFGHQFNVALELPFSWQIFFTSSLFFMFGYFVYLSKAPSIIKDHRNWSEFKNHGQLSRHLYTYADEFNSWKGPLARVKDEEDSNSEVDMKKLYWGIVDESNYKHLKSRWACGLLFLFAFLLISILIVQNIYTVIIFMVNA